MINLIPPEGQKRLQREYTLRAVTVFATLFGLVFVFLSIALVPTYILVSAQIASIQSESTQGGVKSDLLLKVEAETRDIEKIIVQIEKASSTVQVTPLITEIAKLTPEGVTIRSFTVSEEKNVVQKVQVQGTATTRQTLVHFRDNLEASERFKKAEVPLADLARDSDLPFNISIMLDSVK